MHNALVRKMKTKKDCIVAILSPGEIVLDREEFEVLWKMAEEALTVLRKRADQQKRTKKRASTGR